MNYSALTLRCTSKLIPRRAVLWQVLDALKTLEVGILRPECRLVDSSDRVDDGVRHRKAVQRTLLRRLDRELRIEIDDDPLTHHSGYLESVRPTALPQHISIDLEDRERWND